MGSEEQTASPVELGLSCCMDWEEPFPPFRTLRGFNPSALELEGLNLERGEGSKESSEQIPGPKGALRGLEREFHMGSDAWRG